MSKFKAQIPTKEQILTNKHLRFLGRHLHVSNLWHFNRKSVAGGVAVGLFCAWVPVPFQMVLAAIASIFFSVNMPVPITLVWITNPATMPFLYYFAYWLGAKILNSPPKDIIFELNFDWLLGVLGSIWQPFLLGCFIIGTFSSALGYFAVKWVWRYRTTSRWKNRKHVVRSK